MRVCRRWLGNGQDAEDACQATFLVLVARAGELGRIERLDAWLCGVARRVAIRAKMRADRRRAREGATVDVREVPGRDESGHDDLSPILRAEVERLPERYRRPIELCYWEGLSNEQAASRLGCPTGTLKWRLARARETLQGRLARLGVSLLALLMWRLPSAKGSAPDPDAWPSTPGRGWGGDPALDADFVRETVALAALIRDTPLPLLKGGAPSPSQKLGRKSRPIGLSPMLTLFVLACSLGIPALCLAVPSVLDLPTAAYEALFAPEPVVTPSGSCHIGLP